MSSDTKDIAPGTPAVIQPTCICPECGFLTNSPLACDEITCEQCGAAMTYYEEPEMEFICGSCNKNERFTIRASKLFSLDKLNTEKDGCIEVKMTEPPPLLEGEAMTVWINEKSGIKLLRQQLKDNSVVTLSLLFDKTKWDAKSVKKWIREHGYVVVGELFEKVQYLPAILRRMFNYRLDLINEWREHYLEGVAADKPSPREWAWFKFESKYKRSRLGRWREK